MPHVPNVVLSSCKPQEASVTPAEGQVPTAIRNSPIRGIDNGQTWLAQADENAAYPMSLEDASILNALDRVLSKEVITSPYWHDDSPEADDRRLLQAIALTRQRLEAKAARASKHNPGASSPRARSDDFLVDPTWVYVSYTAAVGPRTHMVDDVSISTLLRRDSLDLHRHRLSTAMENDQKAEHPSRQRCATQDGTIQSRSVVRNFHNRIRAARHHQTLHQKLLPAANAAAREAVRRQTKASTRDPQ
jgi:hypothetical protein